MNATDNLTKQLQRLEEQNQLLSTENAQLREENRLLKLQLEEFRQKFFKKNTPKPDDDDKTSHPPKKRGAPQGHPGKTRETPDHFDEHVDVELFQCPECGGDNLSPCNRHEDHYQEDIVASQSHLISPSLLLVSGLP